MKTKITLKIIFAISLVVILIGLICVIFLKNEGEKTPTIDYKIVDNTKSCAEALEEIYKDQKYTYYLPCIKSDNIELVWNNGEKDYLKDAINNKKVSIDSLKEHGLEVIEYEN